VILEAFRDLMPGATVVEVDHDVYIADVQQHPFIQEQMRAGIYSAENIGEDFLSVARTFADERVIEVDALLIEQHMKGVDRVEAFGYVSSIALHEYHHMLHHGGPAVSVEEQVQREVECNNFLSTNYPEIVQAAESAEAQSATIQRVYSRMAALTPRP
jgi:hypothetical protein